MKLISSVNFFIIPGNFIRQTAAISFYIPKRQDSWSNVCEWCENEIQSQQLYLASVPGDWVKLVIGSLKEDRPVIIKDVDMYRESAPDLWKILVHQEILQADASSIVK